VRKSTIWGLLPNALSVRTLAHVSSSTVVVKKPDTMVLWKDTGSKIEHTFSSFIFREQCFVLWSQLVQTQRFVLSKPSILNAERVSIACEQSAKNDGSNTSIGCDPSLLCIVEDSAVITSSVIADRVECNCVLSIPLITCANDKHLQVRCFCSSSFVINCLLLI
jgi:hypothetical protein